MGQSRNLARLDAVESAIPERVREVLAGEVIPEIRARSFGATGWNPGSSLHGLAYNHKERSGTDQGEARDNPDGSVRALCHVQQFLRSRVVRVSAGGIDDIPRNRDLIAETFRPFLYGLERLNFDRNINRGLGGFLDGVLTWPETVTEELRNRDGGIMGTNTGTTGDRGTGTGLRHLWFTAEQACEALGVGSRALRKRVAAGTVERRRVGRRSLYRPLTAAPMTEELRNPTEETAELKCGTADLSGTRAALAPVPQSRPEPEPVHLVNLVQQLTAELAHAKEERGEAVGLGFMLAEQRDDARQERDRLAERIEEIREYKRRLLAALQTAPWHARGLRRRIVAELVRL